MSAWRHVALIAGVFLLGGWCAARLLTQWMRDRDESLLLDEELTTDREDGTDGP